jgi:putative ABC transport system permease protein
LLELRRAAGVRDGEPFRALAATLRAGHRSRQTAILGLAEGARLHRLVDAADQVVAIPPAGLLLSSTLADILRVAPGDAVRVEVLEGRRQVGELRVVAEVDDLLGVSAYMSLTALSRLLGDEDLVSGAFLALDAAAEDSVYAHLRSLPRVAGVTLSSAMVEAYRKTLSEHLLAFSAILVMASVLIAAGVVYNAGRVSLAERERELATLRVIGMTRGETWLILAGELAVLALGAIPLGCALGYGLAALSIAGMSSDLYRVPLVVEPSTFAFAATVVLLATAAVALLLRLRVARLDLVTVLKTKE